MQEYSREEVLTEAKKLAEMLANTKEIERFKQVETKINENQKVQRLITKIKTLQKQAVNLQAYEKKEALKIVEDTLAEAEEELDSIPIVNEFKEKQKIQRLITKIKTLQKQAVNLQAYEKKEALKIVEDTLAEAEEELDSIPIVNEFKEIQETVNNVLQLVSGTIAREVTNHIIESTGGNLLEGKTGSTKENEEPSCSNE